MIERIVIGFSSLGLITIGLFVISVFFLICTELFSVFARKLSGDKFWDINHPWTSRVGGLILLVLLSIISYIIGGIN